MIVGLGLGITAAGHFVVTAAAEVIRAKKGVTAIGNAQIDTAQSKFGGSSALFDGTDDRLTSNLSAFGTGDFTIESWFRISDVSTSRGIFQISTTAGGLQISSSNTLGFQYLASSTEWRMWANGNVYNSSDQTPAANTWYHFAIVRNSGTTKMYVDGVEMASVSDSTDYTGTNLVIGGIYSTSFLMLGHIDEFRISNTARYTTTFTPSTTPFVNDENTLLLLHMDGTDASTVFEDDNGVRGKKGMIAIGNAQVDTAQSKFGGSSLLLDGSGDYLLIAPAQYDLSGDFTLECWFYQNTTSTALKIFDGRGAASAQGGNGTLTLADVLMVDNASGTPYRIRFFVDGAERNSTSQSITNLAWHHMAMVRSGTTFTFYVDGVSYGTYTQSPVKDYSSMLSNYYQVIGASFGTSGFWNGWLDEFRISNTARYTANFTPSTTAFQNDSNTLLLLHMDGTDASTYFEDDNGVRSKKGVTAIGTAQVDTAQSKFGGASALFDGTSDYLDCNQPLIPANSDFTAEAWVRIADKTSNRSIIQQYGSSQTGRFTIQYTSSIDKFTGFMDNGADDINIQGATTPISINTWYHVALTRSGDNWNLWVNGNNDGSDTNSGSVYQGINTYIGARFHNEVFDSKMNGHIDELRISNTARYTANFTPSTTPFQNDSNTLLLLHMDGTDASTVFTDDNGVTPDHDYGA